MYIPKQFSKTLEMVMEELIFAIWTKLLQLLDRLNIQILLSSYHATMTYVHTVLFLMYCL